MLGNLVARENRNSKESQGKTWSVTVTYNIYYSYYEGKDGSGLVAEGVYVTSGATVFNVYADTQDEAESRAKEECSTVCSRSSERYVGKQMYRGKLYHAFETRKVASARAK